MCCSSRLSAARVKPEQCGRALKSRRTMASCGVLFLKLVFVRFAFLVLRPRRSRRHNGVCLLLFGPQDAPGPLTRMFALREHDFAVDDHILDALVVLKRLEIR